MPCGSMPIWLTATDRKSVPNAPSTGYFQLAGRSPSAGNAALPSGATATITARRPIRKKAPRTVIISRLGSNRTTTYPITGNARPKTIKLQPGTGL